MSIITAIRNNYGKYIAKGVGATAVYLCARDAHHWAKIKADERMKTKGAEAAHYYLNNTMSLDKPSLTKSRMKDRIFRWELGQNIRGFCNSFIGYCKGFGASLVSDVIPFALGATALFAKNSKVAKGSAIGLAAMAVFSFFKDGLGIGTNNKIR
ncbi:MAG: hypothetical protein E7Z93_04820 [Cyanobacteria bacterium SIG32]|nr:hypothetical protein [Cyanobacteria bacterium SIG32]